jgi:hypothetical protein
MFVINIKTDNAAFEGEWCCQEIARILEKLAKELKEESSFDSSTLMDINGNRVGFAEMRD